MLLVNQQELPLNCTDKNDKMYPYAQEYNGWLKQAREDYPKGTIKLIVPGYPKKKDKELEKPFSNFSIPLSNPAPGKNGLTIWAYCNTMPIINKNGLLELPTDVRSRYFVVEHYILILDINKEPDFAFYLIEKTPFVKNGWLQIKDEDKEAVKRAKAKRATLDLDNAIWHGLIDENKLRNVAAAWGVDTALDQNTPLDAVRERLDEAVRAAEAKKVAKPEDQYQRGIAEFLKEVTAEPDVRRRAFVEYAFNNGFLIYDKSRGAVDTKKEALLTIPSAYINNHIDFVTSYYGSPQGIKIWPELLKDILPDGVILASQDKKGLISIAESLGVEFDKKTNDALREDIKKSLIME